jgi:hypothetical protein
MHSIANGTNSVSESLNIIGLKLNLMKTSQRSIFDLIEETSTSSQAAFLVSRSAKLEKEKEPTILDISGRKCLEQFERLNQPTLWARTFAASLIGQEGWFSIRCVLTWKLVGTMSNRFYFQLAPSTLPTDEIEFGLLPTPLAQEGAGGSVMKLTDAVEISQGRKPKYYQPTTIDKVKLIGLLPTPMSQESDKITGKENQHSLTKLICSQTLKPSHLNPRFVGEMMGFPPNWTELPFQNGEMKASKPTEMP